MRCVGSSPHQMPVTRSRHFTTTHRGYTGPIPEAVWLVVQMAWETNIAVSSNFAREYSAEIALAASVGWISTVSLDGGAFSRFWSVTAEGVAAYEGRKMFG